MIWPSVSLVLFSSLARNSILRMMEEDVDPEPFVENILDLHRERHQEVIRNFWHAPGKSVEDEISTQTNTVFLRSGDYTPKDPVIPITNRSASIDEGITTTTSEEHIKTEDDSHKTDIDTATIISDHMEERPIFDFEYLCDYFDAQYEEAKIDRILTMNRDLRWIALHQVFWISLANGQYDARAREVLCQLAFRLGLGRPVLIALENGVARRLLEKSDNKIETKEIRQAQQRQGQLERWICVGVASVLGGLAVGLTAGLAAPAIAAGLVGVLGGLGMGSTAVILGHAAFITTLFGTTGAGKSRGTTIQKSS